MKKRHIFLHVVWWVYIALLLLVVIVKFRGSFAELQNKIAVTPWGSNCNLVLFGSVGVQLAHAHEGWARFNLLGNIVPFVPFGFLLPFVASWAGTLARVLAIGLLFVLCAELFQFFTRLGSFDVDDVLLNMTGILLGYGAAGGIRRLRRGKA